MKRLRPPLLSSLLCLLVICAFSVPTYGSHPWTEEPGDHKKDGAHQPYRCGPESNNHIGADAAELIGEVQRSPRSDWLAAAMFEVSCYIYDLLAEDGWTEVNSTHEPDLRE